jgi:protein ImuB
MDDPAPRVLALWCPDWPVTAAAGTEAVAMHRPAAVVSGHRVLACSAVARARGVRRGLRRREAQARCPELVVLMADPDRDARVFERVALAVEELAPGVEVVRPGLLALHAQGPIGFFGGTRQAAERLIDRVAARAGAECQIGVADGLFAATLAARRGVVVAPGRSAEFLAPLPVAELDREPGVDRADLIDLLERLGVRSLGVFAGIPAADIASRFGSDAVLAHRLAQGLDPRPPARRHSPAELAVTADLDPPATRVDQAAFAARALADRLHGRLAEHGLACTRLGIQARTPGAVELARVWRCAEPLTPAGTVDRVRWQLEAWIAGRLIGRGDGSSDEAVGAGDGEPGGIGWLRLSGEEVVTAGELQLGLWGEIGAADERAGRALVRVQALLGADGVLTAVLQGGRGPTERIRLVPWGDDRGERAVASTPGSTGGEVAARGPARQSAGRAGPDAEPVPPWPGRLPSPSPSTVPEDPVPVELLDAAGRPVRLGERHQLTSAPSMIRVVRGEEVAVRGWAGPWSVDQRWWDVATAWRGCWLQVVLEEAVSTVDAPGGGGEGGRTEAAGDPDGETALLLLSRADRWWVAGVYG